MALPEPVTPAPLQIPTGQPTAAGLFTNIPDLTISSYIPEFVEADGPTITYSDVNGYAWIEPN